jgi:hypothetical protein
MCPATIFANNRSDKLANRTTYEINSTDIKKGASTNGTFDGKKLEKNLIPWKYNPTKKILNQEMLDKNKVRLKWLVNGKKLGTKPSKLPNNIK